ncbi:protein of unknown function [Methylocaldum szegediense]|uniref:Uncharacterized protein n=1 Tax=Methylocaldum szegediense TaxID=73780 RepID=A0ABN8X759_9GAMM|nr:protein of unknown function [Methylocaldum szegediense]
MIFFLAYVLAMVEEITDHRKSNTFEKLGRTTASGEHFRIPTRWKCLITSMRVMHSTCFTTSRGWSGTRCCFSTASWSASAG